MNLRRSLLALALCLLPIGAFAQRTELPPGFQRWEMQVDGLTRTGLVFAPESAKSAATPVVFAFHGHGGRSEGAVRSFPMHREWPEAISVYLQGVNTPGRLTDPEGKKPGWQSKAGDHGDRDLKFFDAVLARLKQEYRVDERRIHVTGHSNGGGFTYLLWATRGELFASVAPSGSAAAQSRPLLKPKPVLHVAGENDPLVKYAWQRATMDALRKLNGCAAEGTSWGEHATIFASSTGTPVVEWVHPGGHEFPAGAAAAMVKFFKAYPAAPR
jgi:polyhydroxybutyrate depolymerase